MSKFYIVVDNGKATFEFYQYNKPRRVNDEWEGKMISIKTSGNLDVKPWCEPMYFMLEGEGNRITDTNVPELKQYIEQVII